MFSAVAVPIRQKHSANVIGEYVDAPTSFPAVTIFQIDNSIVPGMRTVNIENAVDVSFEVNVYDNTSGYKKQKAKEVMADIDEIMSELGFTRTMYSPTSNIADASIYRLTARYEASVDSDLWIYQST